MTGAQRLRASPTAAQGPMLWSESEGESSDDENARFKTFEELEAETDLKEQLEAQAKEEQLRKDEEACRVIGESLSKSDVSILQIKRALKLGTAGAEDSSVADNEGGGSDVKHSGGTTGRTRPGMQWADEREINYHSHHVLGQTGLQAQRSEGMLEAGSQKSGTLEGGHGAGLQDGAFGDAAGSNHVCQSVDAHVGGDGAAPQMELAQMDEEAASLAAKRNLWRLWRLVRAQVETAHHFRSVQRRFSLNVAVHLAAWRRRAKLHVERARIIKLDRLVRHWRGRICRWLLQALIHLRQQLLQVTQHLWRRRGSSTVSMTVEPHDAENKAWASLMQELRHATSELREALRRLRDDGNSRARTAADVAVLVRIALRLSLSATLWRAWDRDPRQVALRKEREAKRQREREAGWHHQREVLARKKSPPILKLGADHQPLFIATVTCKNRLPEERAKHVLAIQRHARGLLCRRTPTVPVVHLPSGTQRASAISGMLFLAHQRFALRLTRKTKLDFHLIVYEPESKLVLGTRVRWARCARPHMWVSWWCELTKLRVVSPLSSGSAAGSKSHGGTTTIHLTHADEPLRALCGIRRGAWAEVLHDLRTTNGQRVVIVPYIPVAEGTRQGLASAPVESDDDKELRQAYLQMREAVLPEDIVAGSIDVGGVAAAGAFRTWMEHHMAEVAPRAPPLPPLRRSVSVLKRPMSRGILTFSSLLTSPSESSFFPTIPTDFASQAQRLGPARRRTSMIGQLPPLPYPSASISPTRRTKGSAQLVGKLYAVGGYLQDASWFQVEPRSQGAPGRAFRADLPPREAIPTIATAVWP